MRGFAAIFRRELWRRRHLFLVAVGAAVIALLMPFVPGLPENPAAEVRQVTAAVLALLLGFVSTVVCGGAIAGRDLTEDRFVFDFARPVSATAIWFGRVGGAIATVLLVEVIAGSPALPAVATLSGSIMVMPTWVAFWLAYVGVPVLLLLVHHGIGIASRARTSWIALDVAGFAVWATAGWLIVRPFVRQLQPSAPGLVVLAVTALGIALAVGSWRQFEMGRADLGRGHRSLSISTWASVAVLLAGLGLYAGWLWRIEPSDLDERYIGEVSPDGRWFELVGTASDRWEMRGRFLVSTETGSWLRSDATLGRWSHEVTFAAATPIAIIDRPAGHDDRRDLFVVDLDTTTPRQRPLGLDIGPDEWYWPSPAGDLVVIASNNTVSVVAIEGTRQLMAARLPGEHWGGVPRFTSERTLRVLRRSDSFDATRLEVVDLDFDRKRLAPVATKDIPKALGAWLTRDGTVVEVVSREDPDNPSSRRFITRYDALTLEAVGRSDLPQTQDSGVRVLSENLTVDFEHGGGTVDFTIHGDAGDVIGRQTVACGATCAVGPVAGPWSLFIRSGTFTRDRSIQTDVLDLKTGELNRLGDGLTMAWDQWRAGQRMSSPNVSESALPTYWLFSKDAAGIIRWNPVTDELVPVPGLAGHHPEAGN